MMAGRKQVNGILGKLIPLMVQRLEKVPVVQAHHKQNQHITNCPIEELVQRYLYFWLM
jgi:hypothetical protein